MPDITQNNEYDKNNKHGLCCAKLMVNCDRLFVGIGGNGNNYTNKYHVIMTFLLPYLIVNIFTSFRYQLLTESSSKRFLLPSQQVKIYGT
jgi:hypothetical protein